MRNAHAAPSHAAMIDPSLRAGRRSRVLRSRRLALLLYALLLTVATHWPRLALSPEIPASDKTIHLIAFGILTILLWRSGLFGPRWLVAIIALAWAGIDEVSQGIPVLHRSVSWHDWIANACGVTCAMAIIWAMRPMQDAEQLDGPNQVASAAVCVHVRRHVRRAHAVADRAGDAVCLRCVRSRRTFPPAHAPRCGRVRTRGGHRRSARVCIWSIAASSFGDSRRSCEPGHAWSAALKRSK